LETAYQRGTFTSSSDGAFALAVFNNLSTLTALSVLSSSSNPSYSLAPAANSTVIVNSADMARVLGFSLRLYPQIAATSPPGLVYAGVAPRCSLIDLTLSGTVSTQYSMNQTSANLSNLAVLQTVMPSTIGNNFIQINWRPSDNRDFEFHEVEQSLLALTASTNYLMPASQSPIGALHLDTEGAFLVAVGQSLPASTNVHYEIILHLECTTSLQNIAHAVDDDEASCASLSGFPTMESLFRSAAGDLSPSVTLATISGAVLGSNLLQRAAIRGYNTARRGVLRAAEGAWDAL